MATRKNLAKPDSKKDAAKRKREGEAITKRLNEIYSREDSRLDPGLMRAQVRSWLNSTKGDEW
jgi:hypothetical protein